MNINWYKRIIKSKDTRLFILKMLWFLPNKIMLSLQYRVKLRRKLNWKDSKRFTEKIQKYKIKYKNPILPILVDKYEVKRYLNELGFEKYVAELYGVYESFDEIDFDKLPNEFVMKSTNGSGGNEVLFVDKTNMNINDIKIKTKGWTKETKSRWSGREYAYHNIKGKILIEKRITNQGKPIDDYKIFCFNGKAKYIVVDMDRFKDHKRNIYDLNWNHLKINSDKNYLDITLDKPENFEEMINLAETLSKDFPFLRVDLYNVEGNIYFGELTFYPWSGYISFEPDEFDFELGRLFDYY